MDLQSLVTGSVHALGLASLSAAIGGLILELLVVPANLNERGHPQRAASALDHHLARCSDAGDPCRSRYPDPDDKSRPARGCHRYAPRGCQTHPFWRDPRCAWRGLALAVLLSIAQSVPLRFFCLLITVAITLTTSLTGHAADWGDLTFYIAVDWAHVVAASAWTGGLFALAWIILRQRVRLPSASVALIARRFSRLAAVCLATVVLTGIYNAWSQLEGVSRLWTTVYGQVLFVKLLFAAGLVWLGAVNRYVIMPRLCAHRRADGIGIRLFRVLRLVLFGARNGTSTEPPPPSCLDMLPGRRSLCARGIRVHRDSWRSNASASHRI